MSNRFRLVFGGALLAAASLSAALAAPATPGAFSIEDVLSAPFPSDLVASPDGGAVAWVFDDRGSRNVWAASAPDWTGRAITSYRGDDGQEISDLSFSGDGKTIVFVRGGDANRSGEIPNPSLVPEGAEQAVFSVPISGGGAPKRLGEGTSAAFQPKGGRVAWVLKGRQAGRALQGARHGCLPPVVSGRRPPRLRQPARRSQLRRSLRSRRKGAPVSRSQRRPRRLPRLVSGRPADRVSSRALRPVRPGLPAAPRR